MIKSQLKWSQASLISGFHLLIISLLVIGIFLRLVNLDRKIYWADEVFTSLQISGHTTTEMNQNLRTGEIITVADLRQYQYPSPNTTALDTIRVLAEDDSQHVPLYHVLVQKWVQWFGNSIAVIRSVSAIISLLAFPAIYWLCNELFHSPQTGWMAVALLSVSPFHLLYAKEARPYSLFIVAILLSSAALLRAVRVRSPLAWGMYAFTLIIGLYTQIFFGLVAIGHGVYLLIIERFRLNRTTLSYLSSSLIAFLAFFPWIVVILNSPSQFDANRWAGDRTSLLSSLTKWAGIISRAFIDLGVGPDAPLMHLLPLVPLILTLLILLGYSLYFLYKTTSPRIWLFIVTLIGVTGLAFAIPDFVFGLRYGTTRFLTACIVGLQLALAHLFVSKIFPSSYQPERRSRSNAWASVMAVVFSIGLLSGIINAHARIWWNTKPEVNQHMFDIATMLNQADSPLIISDSQLIEIQVLGHLLNDEIRLQIVDEQTIPDVPSDSSQIFLFNPSESLYLGLQNKYNLFFEKSIGSLWRVKEPNGTVLQ